MDTSKFLKVSSLLLSFCVVVGLLVLFVAPTAMAANPTMGGGQTVQKHHFVVSWESATSPGPSCMDSMVNAGVAAYDKCVEELKAQCSAGETLDSDSVGFDVQEGLSYCTENDDGTFDGTTVLICWGNCVPEVIEPSRN